MTFTWASSPWTLLLLGLAIYRTTWAWLKAMLPPLPWLRAKLTVAIERRAERPFRETDGSISSDGRRDYYSAIARNGGQPTLNYLLTCFSCAGFWVALGWVLAASLLPTPVWMLPAAALAGSAAAGLLGPDHE